MNKSTEDNDRLEAGAAFTPLLFTSTFSPFHTQTRHVFT